MYSPSHGFVACGESTYWCFAGAYCCTTAGQFLAAFDSPRYQEPSEAKAPIIFRNGSQILVIRRRSEASANTVVLPDPIVPVITSETICNKNPFRPLASAWRTGNWPLTAGN